MSEKNFVAFNSDEGGFVPIILIIALAAVVLVGGGFYLFNRQASPQTAEIVEPSVSDSHNLGVSPSPKQSAKPKSIPIQVTTTISTAKPNSSPLTGADGSLPLSSSAPEVIINAAGSFSASGQEIKYSITFAKNGGPVTGNVAGLCTGPITGNFKGGDGGAVNGRVDAVCKIGILEQDLKADFAGKVYFSQGRADLQWQGDIPFYSGSKEFSLSFTPL